MLNPAPALTNRAFFCHWRSANESGTDAGNKEVEGKGRRAVEDVSEPCRPTPNGTLEAVRGGAECVCRQGRNERGRPLCLHMLLELMHGEAEK